MKKITYDDLYEFNFVSGVNCSPNGKNILFINKKADKDTNKYNSYIYVLNTDTQEYKQLTFSGSETLAKWLSDSEILFMSKRKFSRYDEHSSDESNFFKVSLNGGEASHAFTIPFKVNDIHMLSNGKFLIYAARKCVENKQAGKYEAIEGEDYLVFDEIFFWYNGKGIRNKIRDSLYIFDPACNTITQISNQFTSVESYSLSPDKSKILFCGNTYTDVYTEKGGLYLYDLSTKETKNIIPEGKFELTHPKFLGNDKAFFALNREEFSGQNAYFNILDIDSLNIKELPYADFQIGGAVGSDAKMGGGSNIKFYEGKLYMTHAYWSKTKLIAIDFNGNIEDICAEDGSINNFDIVNDTIYMSAMRNNHLAEVYSHSLSTGQETKLTSFNDEYHKEHIQSEHEYFIYKDRDGVELEGYVMKPAGYIEGKKYPAVLEMHGGPKGIFGRTFFHEMQILSAKGYFVFFTNPRGSDGRGSKFAAMTGNLGKEDFDDFMDFTDEIIKRYPDINDKKIGICGGSYGGFMCNYMIGHTDRYAAAASQRSISNYLTKSLTTDIGYYYNMQQLNGTPWTNIEDVWNTSPLKMGHKAVTPTLFIQSDEDYRCWMSDAVQMFTAIKLAGTPSKICLFHKENHELSRSGKPENRIARLTEICNWFDTYLK